MLTSRHDLMTGSESLRDLSLSPEPTPLVDTTGLALAGWVEWMAAAGMSVRTIEGRTQLIERIGRDGMNSIDCDWRAVAGWLANPKFTAGTRMTYYNTLRQWFHWLVVFDYRTNDPTAKLHKPRSPNWEPRPITTDQLGTLLTTRMHKRTRTMILLAAYQGLRVHEIAAMRGDHIRGDILRLVGKGGVTAVLPLHAVIAAEAAQYPPVGWWFPSQADEDRGLRYRSVSAIISNAMGRAGVDATPHALRHWYGTEVLNAADGNLRVAQELLRHKSPATTARYTKIADHQRRAAIDRLPILHGSAHPQALDPCALSPGRAGSSR
jgi:integrase/recombinase XerD